MKLVIDASVALKWVLNEDGSQEAQALLNVGAQRAPMAAPDFLWTECANVIWLSIRRERIASRSASAAFALIDAAPIEKIESRPLLPSAIQIAIELGCSPYDCLYLAAAQSERATMVTADARFAAAARGHPVYAPLVHVLGEART